ncbi:MAG: hypothetical protein ABIJ65_04110 [Chloroflexota bacterium]
MKYRVSTIVLIAALLLLLIVQNIQAAPNLTTEPSANLAAPAGDYDFTTHGTAWVAELPTQFDIFRPNGWGISVSSKKAGYFWVHIPISYPSRIANDGMEIKYVEFCAQSTNGAITKPVTMDLWEYPGKIVSVPVTWAANNNKQCFGYTFSPAVWAQDLGISLKLKFANPAHKITLYKAWVRIVP